MSIWNRKAEQQQKVIDETTQIVHDFRLRVPYGDYRVMPYEVYPVFLAFQQEVDEYLRKLFAGEVDDANGNLLDNLIDDVTEKAFADLDRQRTTHEDRYKALSESRPIGDRRQYEEERRLLESVLQETEEDLQEIRSRCRAEKFEKDKRRAEK